MWVLLSKIFNDDNNNNNKCDLQLVKANYTSINEVCTVFSNEIFKMREY